MASFCRFTAAAARSVTLWSRSRLASLLPAKICSQGFQRDQNLQMHRSAAQGPWKLLKREAGEAVWKRVFMCPKPSCLHHDPSHAFGDLVGIKKHFRRKHSGHRQGSCDRCSKAYAIHPGTRGHYCDCGRVFSRYGAIYDALQKFTVRCMKIATGLGT